MLLWYLPRAGAFRTGTQQGKRMVTLDAARLETYAVTTAGECSVSLREAIAMMSDAPEIVAAHLGREWTSEMVVAWACWALNIVEARQ